MKWVSEKIGQPLQAKKVDVGERLDGSTVQFAFDGVSEDGKTGVLVSTSLTTKSGSTRKLHVDASILLEANFEQRIMAFISEETKQNFINKVDGLLPLSRIELFICDDLPDGMWRKIKDFQAKAKSEVGDKGKSSKVGGPRK